MPLPGPPQGLRYGVSLLVGAGVLWVLGGSMDPTTLATTLVASAPHPTHQPSLSAPPIFAHPQRHPPMHPLSHLHPHPRRRSPPRSRSSRSPTPSRTAATSRAPRSS